MFYSTFCGSKTGKATRSPPGRKYGIGIQSLQNRTSPAFDSGNPAQESGNKPVIGHGFPHFYRRKKTHATDRDQINLASDSFFYTFAPRFVSATLYGHNKTAQRNAASFLIGKIWKRLF
jgi:hypothetical protein